MSAPVVPDSPSAENAHLSPKPHLTQAKPVRRRCSREEKLRILRLVDTCTERGQVAAILRREGIYSTLNDFRKQQQQGRLATKTERAKHDSYDNENELARLRRENVRLQCQVSPVNVPPVFGHDVPPTFGQSVPPDGGELLRT